MNSAIQRMTDQEIVDLMQSGTPLAQMRRLFYSHVAKIEQAEAQRRKPTVMELRKMEFEAAEEMLNLASRFCSGDL